MDKKIIKQGFLAALAEGVYILLVALIMLNADKIFGPGPEIFSMITFLLLFVFSAAISGALILGKPVLLYLENKKVEALKLFFSTLGWLLILLLILFIVLTIK